MEENRLRQIIREAFVTQFDLFDEPTVTRIRKPKRKMTDWEKENRRQELQLKKRIKAENDFENYWKERGIVQGNMFDEECVSKCVNEAIDNVLSEEGINIKPENKGKFTKTKQETGKTTSELLNSENALTKKRANFARMAKRGWKPLKK